MRTAGPTEVACRARECPRPACRAKPGHPCVTRNGTPMSYAHPERIPPELRQQPPTRTR